MMNLRLVTKKGRKIIRIKNIRIGKDFVVIAGPCAVESEEQFLKTAILVKKHGAHLLRANVFKPRTSPYSFQGLGMEGMKIVEKVKDRVKLPVAIEVLDPRFVERVASVADVLQIGARNMQNFPLLKEVGKIDKPVLLKRGLSATVKEWLSAAEYIMNEGNEKVILCERGVRTFSRETRFTLDLSSVLIVKRVSNLPIIVDPSHAAGDRDLVIPLAKAAKVVGSDGVMVEVHPNPEEALSDSKQQLTFDMFEELMIELRKLKC